MREGDELMKEWRRRREPGLADGGAGVSAQHLLPGRRRGGGGV